MLDVLVELPRQYTALENAMAAFGDAFELGAFKRAFSATDDFDAYNRAQAVERALSRVQNFLADLAEAGVKLAELPVPEGTRGSRAERAFASLRAAGVIDPALCGRLCRAQQARSQIEHGYLRTNAGQVHAAAQLVRDITREFVPRYRRWIEPYLPA